VSWISSLLRRNPALDTAQLARLEQCRRMPAVSLDLPFGAQRVLVVDVESSGLDPYADRLLSIGAIDVSAGVIRLDSAFEVLLRQEWASADENILVHHIGGSAQLAGRERADGLLDFLCVSGKAPLVAFHVDFDRVLIERTVKAVLGIRPENSWLDLALLAPALFPKHAATARVLDDWLRVFGIENHARHNALADALATAQLLLAVLAAAKGCGLATWADLARLQKDQRWLAESGRIV